MESKLLNPLAIDDEGKLISVDHARKGQTYFCPKCNQPLKYCAKGPGPNARTSHFKHKVHTDCHGLSESEIHKMAKEGIYEILLSAIANHRDLHISWTCPECGQDVNANLLKMAKSVVTEKEFGSTRPDIALLDENGKPFVAVEIVFKHEATPETIDFYENNNIVHIRLVFHSLDECKNLMHKLQYPDSVNVCYNKSCPHCQSSKTNRGIYTLLNSERNAINGLAVGLFNPFGDEPILGLKFTEQDKQNAIAIVNKNWPQYQLQFKENTDFPHATFEYKRTVIQPRRPQSRYRGSFIDYFDNKMENPQSNNHYRSSKGKKSGSTKKYGAKKTGGKRRY